MSSFLVLAVLPEKYHRSCQSVLWSMSRPWSGFRACQQNLWSLKDFFEVPHRFYAIFLDSLRIWNGLMILPPKFSQKKTLIDFWSGQNRINFWNQGSIRNVHQLPEIEGEDLNFDFNQNKTKQTGCGKTLIKILSYGVQSKCPPSLWKVSVVTETMSLWMGHIDVNTQFHLFMVQKCPFGNIKYIPIKYPFVYLINTSLIASLYVLVGPCGYQTQSLCLYGRVT